MKKFVFTQQLLDDYYENRFHKDLNRFFLVEKEGDTEVAKGFNELLPSIFHVHNIPVLVFLNNTSVLAENEDYYKRDRNTNYEEEILFIALISFIYAAEHIFFRKTRDIMNNTERAACINAFGYPWLECVERMNLAAFLSLSWFSEEIRIANEMSAFRDALQLVQPFMLEKLISFFRSWNGGSLYQNHYFVDTLGEYIGETVNRDVRQIYREKFYKYNGLMGFDFSAAKIDEYFNEHFFDHLKKYFSCAEEKDGYLQILYVPYHNNNRWDDGHPGNNFEDDLLFASIFLYMIIAEQSFLKCAPEAEKDFHRCSGWPEILSGPGAAEKLSPLKMLDYAGLSPMKYEAHLLKEVVEKVFPHFRIKMNMILNGTMPSINDQIAKDNMANAIRYKRNNIKKYLDKEQKNIEELLGKWGGSPASDWNQFYTMEGIPVMIGYDTIDTVESKRTK